MPPASGSRWVNCQSRAMTVFVVVILGYDVHETVTSALKLFP
jgi:hypothetical protein